MAIFGRDAGADQQPGKNQVDGSPAPTSAEKSEGKSAASRAAEKAAPGKVRRAKKIKSKADSLAVKIAEMQEQLREAQRAEREAQEAELLRLVRKASCLDEAIEWVSKKLA